MTFKSLHQSNDHDWLNGPLHPPHEMLGEEREKKGTNKGGGEKKAWGNKKPWGRRRGWRRTGKVYGGGK